MRLCAALLVIACSGCNFAVDAVDVTAGDGSADLSGPVDDLAAPDLSSGDDLNTVDLRSGDLNITDLLPAGDMTCAPPLFTGFTAGVTSLDCRRCGCVVDDFTSFSASRWTRTVSSGWSDAMSAGTLIFSASSLLSPSMDQLSSDGHFYLQGDFDIQVDYNLVSWPMGVGENIGLLGPGATAPTIYAHTYQTTSKHLYLQVDNLVSDTTTTANSGTFRVIRSGDNICSSMAGQPPQCRAGSETTSVAVTVQANFNNPNCAGGACATAVEAHLSNFKLNSGVIVASP